MNKFFNSRFYLVFWLFLAALPMKQAFDISKEIDHDVQKSMQGQVEQSSVARAEENPYTFEDDKGEVNRISDEQLLSILELTPEEYEKSGSAKNPFALSPSQLDSFEEALRESSGLAKDSALDFMTISGAEADVNYEDVAACAAGADKARLNVESVLVRTAKQHPVFASVIAERAN